MDKCSLNYRDNEGANISGALERIIRSIIDGTYNETQTKLTEYPSSTPDGNRCNESMQEE
jgi:hypothetical protein